MRELMATGMLLFTSIALAQSDPPVTGRPVEFSNIVGKWEKPRVTATPTTVHVEEPIRLEIHLKGTGPAKYEPNRKYIKRLFPASFANDFYIEPLPEEDKVLAKEQTWVFVYQLKPKHPKVEAIDGIRLVYYDPAIGGKRGYVVRDAEPIKITVKRKPIAPLPIEIPQPIATPESFQSLEPASVVLVPAAPKLDLPLWALVLVLVVPPLICVLGVYSYRYIFPDDVRRASRFRNEAAQRALAKLQSESETPWLAVEQYLQDRFDFPAHEAAPAEVEQFLLRRGFAKDLCVKARTFFDACDATRFGVTVVSPPNFDTAARLIQALEEDPCAAK